MENINIININNNKVIHRIEFDKHFYSQFDVANIINDQNIKYIKIIIEPDDIVVLVNYYEDFEELNYENLCQGLLLIDGVLKNK